MRVRRGVYVPTEDWLGGTAAHRYALTTASLAVGRPAPVLCRETALLAWGLALPSVPSHVRYRTARRSAAGSVPVGGLYGDVAAVSALYAGLRGESGRLPMGFPDARHFGDGTDAVSMDVPNLGLRLPIEPFDSAIADTLHRLPFVESVVLADAVLAGRGAHSVRRGREDLAALASRLPSAAAKRRMIAVVTFADGLSESVGESLSRALMRELGFEMPQLQVWVHRDGRRVARVDFYWPRLRLVGEFDGAMKYTRAQALSGRTAAEVVLAEKRREDEIRAGGDRVIRWGWDDLVHPERLAMILHRAGVPRSV
ncbi:MAG: hypothetical protein HOQ07_05935 [Sinomonas sp.]|nr:hypothetical protein [Sinomonas sp.]